MSNDKENFAHEILYHDGGMPKGMTRCEKYGMTWGCDVDCPVLQAGKCELKDSENKDLYQEYLNTTRLMKKTIAQWLQELPEPYRTKALNNSRGRTNRHEEVDSLSTALMCAFFWKESPEGHDYWDRFNLSLE